MPDSNVTNVLSSQSMIEVDSVRCGKKQKSGLADFAFRRFADLGLAKSVCAIDEGQVEMSPAQHKARGVLYVTQVSRELMICRCFKCCFGARILMVFGLCATPGIGDEQEQRPRR